MRNGGFIGLAAVLLAVATLSAKERPVDRFLKVTQWEGTVHLVYDFKEAGENSTRTVHAITDWTVTLNPLGRSSEPGEPLLTFNGAWMGRGAGGESAEYPAGKGDRHTTSQAASGTAEVWKAFKIYPDGYEFDSFGWVDFKGTMQGTCSKGTCTFDKEGSVCASNTDDWSIKRPFPGQGMSLSGSATLAAGAPGQQISKGSTYRVTWEFHPAGEAPPLQAVPNIAPSVERGGVVTLDGAQSKGRIRDYKWTFKSSGTAAPDAEKHGAQQQVTVLDALSVTLTVSDGKATDSKTVSVKVTPRERFRTLFEHIAEEGRIARSLKPYCTSTNRNSRGEKEWFAVWDGGENVCAFDPPAAAADKPHILHPDPEKAGADELYELASVDDPGGPWDGFYYFKEWKCEVKRQTLLNTYIVPDGPPVFPGMSKNFYQTNLEKKFQIKEYLADVRLHERQHSDLMKAALKERDPAKECEKAYGKDEQKLRKDADARIRETEKRMHERTKDPLPQEWTVKLVVPKDDTYEWMEFDAKVGGASSADL